LTKAPQKEFNYFYGVKMFNYFLIFLFISTFFLINAAAKERDISTGRKTPMLMTHGEAVRASVADAYVYALSEKFNRNAQLGSEEFVEMVLSRPLCNSGDSRQVSKKMINQLCWVINYPVNDDCKDIDGCIELRVHKSVYFDKELNALLYSAVRNPCEHIPINTRFHWTSLFYPNWVSYGNLNCKKDRLPYSTAYITYGDTRVELEL